VDVVALIRLFFNYIIRRNPSLEKPISNTYPCFCSDRHESKDIIRNAVGASEHDAVIFCGSGATAAIHKLINAVVKGSDRPAPIVFIGPYEHHSNILPWRDAGAEVNISYF